MNGILLNWTISEANFKRPRLWLKATSSKLSELEMKGVDLSNIIFRSEEMERIIEMALRVAKVDSTILLLGESGVGKGMIAKLIHRHSERSGGPFIRVDCAGIPDTLIESELFGYERGAFTGAKTKANQDSSNLLIRGLSSSTKLEKFPLAPSQNCFVFWKIMKSFALVEQNQRKLM